MSDSKRDNFKWLLKIACLLLENTNMNVKKISKKKKLKIFLKFSFFLKKKKRKELKMLQLFFREL